MRILGIDPGSLKTGYGIVDLVGEELAFITCGAIVPPAKASFPEKILLITRKIEELISKYQPEAVALEDLFYAKNAKTAIKLGQVRGGILFAVASSGVPLFEYSPLEVKSAVVGYGRAGKDQVKQMVSALLSIDPPPSSPDATDALALAICHAHSLRLKRLIEGERL
ncbi:MAG: crossover junction endodeoxyribonuclease RuvC [Acidobacteria bacterium]|nr:crossover junction endodeoxyribonuclease RuvC [Acidobacteriota bacterium]